MKPKKLRKSLYKRLKTFVKDLIKLSPDDELEEGLNDIAAFITQSGAPTNVPIAEAGDSVKMTASKQYESIINELVELSSENELIELDNSMQEMFRDLGIDENGRLILEEQDISILDLYPYTIKILEDNEIYSVAELLRYTEKDLLAVKGLGPKAVMRIDDALKKVGLKGLRVEELQK